MTETLDLSHRCVACKVYVLQGGEGLMHTVVQHTFEMPPESALLYYENKKPKKRRYEDDNAGRMTLWDHLEQSKRLYSKRQNV